MERGNQAVTYMFTVGGEQAGFKMEQLISYARTLGEFAICDVSHFEELETGRQTATEHLRSLLTQPGPYRDQWMPYAAKPREGELSQAAVTRVIANWLQSRQQEAEGRVPDARQLKDRVSRALGSGSFTPDTLECFIGAFGLDADDAYKLWAAYHSSPNTE